MLFVYLYSVKCIYKSCNACKGKKKVCMAQEGSCEPINVKVFCEL